MKTSNRIRTRYIKLEFRGEFQVGSRQILRDPLVDALVQLGAEVIFPVASLTCEKCVVDDDPSYSLSKEILYLYE